MARRDSNGKFVSENGEPDNMAEGQDAGDSPVSEEIPPDAAPPVDDGATGTIPPGKRRGPGRPPGSGANKNKTSRARPNMEALSRQIMGAHSLAAMFLGIPELLIDATEARLLADGMAGVAEEFGLSLGGKAGAIMVLVANAGMVYTPRVIAIAKRVQMQNAQSASPSNVSPVAPHGNVFTTDFKREP
jgi:hypothetical protein